LIQAEVIVCAIVTIIGGVLIARNLQLRRRSSSLAKRLELWDNLPTATSPTIVHKSNTSLDQAMFPATNEIGNKIELLIHQSGMDMPVPTFVALAILLFVFPIAIGLLFELHLAASMAVGLVFATIPAFALMAKRAALRTKFINQLPDAIDLMISVLRSGHSIPQAVKTVGDELPSPCGAEFHEVMQRMNLGQPLSGALAYSCDKYNSVELDLLRRAVCIQSEVGGSLAELLDKTNSTLRQRLKLVRHVKVLTTQSKMTAVIVGLLPIFMAIGLQFLSPNYLTPLIETKFGNILIVVAIVLQIMGIALMRKLATVKV
jgi:tight adherence protein B